MRINTMSKTNKPNDPYNKYYIMALFGGIVLGFLLIFAFNMLIVLGKVLIKYWYAPLIIILVIIFFRRRKKKHENQRR